MENIPRWVYTKEFKKMERDLLKKATVYLAGE